MHTFWRKERNQDRNEREFSLDAKFLAWIHNNQMSTQDDPSDLSLVGEKA